MSHRHGFTLVEMTIVIGIVVLLAGLTMAVSVSIIQGSEVRQTELAIELLDTAMREWEVQSDRKISYGIDDIPEDGMFYEIQRDDFDPAQVTGELLTIISRSTSIKEILARIDTEFLIYDSRIQHLQIRDAWGQPIIAIFPGRNWVAGDEDDEILRDLDGTIRTLTELQCGLTSNRQICFVSAGPDSELGLLDAQEDSDEYAQTRDNVYSYAPVADSP